MTDKNNNNNNNNNNTNNWLEKYDSVFVMIQKSDEFINYSNNLETTEQCISTFINIGNVMRTYINIDNYIIELLTEDNIKNCLNILLSCIIKYNLLKYNKSLDETYLICRNLFEKKNNDYGDAFIDYKIIGILMRLNDKIRRLESLHKKSIVNFESIDDTILDSFNYVILALILFNYKS